MRNFFNVSTGWILVLYLFSAPTLLAREYSISEEVVNRNGLDLFTQRICPAKSGSTFSQLLLVHGLTYSSHEFDVNYRDYSLARFFARKGYCVWMFDVAGYGRSERPADGFVVDSNYALSDLEAVAKHIRTTTAEDKISLLGWSWGTVLAGRLASKRGDWIDKLVLYAPILHAFDGDAPEEPWHKNSWTHAADDLQKSNDGRIDTDLIDAAVASIYLSNCWRWDGESSPNGGRRDVLQGTDVQLINLSQIEVPVLLIGGSRDPYLSWSEIENAFRQFFAGTESRMVRLEGGSHILMLEKDHYKRFRKTVLAFLR